MFQSERTTNHRAKVLIVDDRIDNLELLSTICALHGFEAVTSDCGELAIELAIKVHPQVILLDVSMPRMDGFTVCQILKNNIVTKDIPVIFITVLEEIKDKIYAFELGGNDYITKPFHVEDVVKRIKTQIKLYSKIDEKNQELVQVKQERQAAEIKLLELNQKLVALTSLDKLTNLSNRFYFDEILAREWKRGEKDRTILSLILCNIDNFKLDNNRFGDREGVCLKLVAEEILKIVTHSGDLVARCGEEFAMILPQTEAKKAMLVAEKTRQQINRANISHPDLDSNCISLSLGVSSIAPFIGHTEEQLLTTTRMALDEAKKQGGNITVCNPVTYS